MHHDALTTFRTEAHAAFGPLTTEMIAAVKAALVRLTRASATEPWLRALHEEARPSAKPS